MSVIGSASYYTLDHYSEPTMQATSETSLVTYFTADGQQLQACNYNQQSQLLARLDPQAAKPVVSKIQLRNFYRGKQIDSASNSASKETYIVFFDCHDNVLAMDKCQALSYDGNSQHALLFALRLAYSNKYDLKTRSVVIEDLTTANDNDTSQAGNVSSTSDYFQCVIM